MGYRDAALDGAYLFSVAHAFQRASEGDFPVARSNGGQEGVRHK